MKFDIEAANIWLEMSLKHRTQDNKTWGSFPCLNTKLTRHEYFRVIFGYRMRQKNCKRPDLHPVANIALFINNTLLKLYEFRIQLNLVS